MLFSAGFALGFSFDYMIMLDSFVNFYMRLIIHPLGEFRCYNSVEELMRSKYTGEYVKKTKKELF